MDSILGFVRKYPIATGGIGVVVIVALVAPYKDIRDEFKVEMQNNLVEIYVHTSVERGRESYFVSDYEPPVSNYIDVDTTETLTDCFYKLVNQLTSYGNFPPASLTPLLLLLLPNCLLPAT